MSVSVLNTDAGLSGKTLINLEDTQTITGAKTFDRDPSAPFAVTSGSAVVTNLDADKVDGLEGAALAEIANTETISAVWTFSAKPAINAGLQFPASQAADAGANVLDDYEEGALTITVTFGGASTGLTVGSSDGKYVKVGKNVWFTGVIALTNKGSSTGAAKISLTGLPAVEGDSQARLVSVVPFNLTGLTGVVAGLIEAGASTIQLYQSDAAGYVSISDTVFTNTATLYFSGYYRTAN